MLKLVLTFIIGSVRCLLAQGEIDRSGSQFVNSW
jgi:hypothetical protein